MEKEKLISLIEAGETFKTEFKQDFVWNENTKQIRYLKGIVGLHNHDGGCLIFGVTDDGDIIGVNEDFDKLDNADIVKAIRKYFTPTIHKFSKKVLTIGGKNIGVIEIEKRTGIPSVCKVNSPELKLIESEIYFRYNSETVNIKSGDLVNMLHELSGTKELEESIRKNKIEMKPFFKQRGGYYNESNCRLEFFNVGRGIATIKEIVQLEGSDNITLSWQAKNNYGQRINVNEEFPLLGYGLRNLQTAKWKIRFIFTDEAETKYYQDFMKESYSNIIETEPKEYNE